MPRDEPAARAGAISQTTLIAVGYLLLSIVGIVGLSMGSVPFAVDLPNHAARLYVECNPTDPVLSRMYSVEYSLIPNLAIDLLNRPFCGLVDPMTFLRATMALTMMGILLVVWELHRFLSRVPNAFVLLAPAMTFNLVTSMGYLNYLIGTLLFLTFAWTMLRFEVIEKHPALAFLLPNLFGALIFLCHIFALALAGVLLFGFRFAVANERNLLVRSVRAGVPTLISFAFPGVMMLLVKGSELAPAFVIAGKVRTIWAPFLYLSTGVAAFMVAIWIALFYWGFREKLLTVASSLRWPLGFLLGFVAIVPSGLGLAVDVDARTFVSILYLAAAALGSSSARPEGKTRLQLVVAFVAFATLATQIAVLAPRLGLYNKQVAEFRAALTTVAPSSTVLPMVDPDQTPAIHYLYYAHLSSFATLDRRAFDPINFTGRSMQPMSAIQSYACIDVPVGLPISGKIANDLLTPEGQQGRRRWYRHAFSWDRNFDRVIYYHFGAKGNPAPQHLKPIVEGSFFTIFRTTKPLGRRPCAA